MVFDFTYDIPPGLTIVDQYMHFGTFALILTLENGDKVRIPPKYPEVARHKSNVVDFAEYKRRRAGE